MRQLHVMKKEINDSKLDHKVKKETHVVIACSSSRRRRRWCRFEFGLSPIRSGANKRRCGLQGILVSFPLRRPRRGKRYRVLGKGFCLTVIIYDKGLPLGCSSLWDGGRC